MLEQFGKSLADAGGFAAVFQDSLCNYRNSLEITKTSCLERARAVDDEIKELRSAFSKFSQSINDLEATNQGLMKGLREGLDKTIAGTDELIGEPVDVTP